MHGAILPHRRLSEGGRDRHGFGSRPCLQFADQPAGLRDREPVRRIDAEPLVQQLGEIEVPPPRDGLQGADLAWCGPARGAVDSGLAVAFVWHDLQHAASAP